MRRNIEETLGWGKEPRDRIGAQLREISYIQQQPPNTDKPSGEFLLCLLRELTVAKKRRNCYSDPHGRRPQARTPHRGQHSRSSEDGTVGGGKKVPATVSAIADAVRWAEEIMKEIDSRWPARTS